MMDSAHHCGSSAGVGQVVEVYLLLNKPFKILQLDEGPIPSQLLG